MKYDKPKTYNEWHLLIQLYEQANEFMNAAVEDEQKYILAERWYRKAANHGYVPAMKKLAKMLTDGKCEPMVTGEDQYWTREAKKQEIIDGLNGNKKYYKE